MCTPSLLSPAGLVWASRRLSSVCPQILEEFIQSVMQLAVTKSVPAPVIQSALRILAECVAHRGSHVSRLPMALPVCIPQLTNVAMQIRPSLRAWLRPHHGQGWRAIPRHH